MSGMADYTYPLSIEGRRQVDPSLTSLKSGHLIKWEILTQGNKKTTVEENLRCFTLVLA